MKKKNRFRSENSLIERLDYEHGSKKVTRKILRKFKDEFDWACLLTFQKLTESMIEDYSKYMNWSDVCRYQKLSEDFMRKHKENLDWETACKFQQMSEDFVNSVVSMTQEQKEIYNNEKNIICFNITDLYGWVFCPTHRF